MNCDCIVLEVKVSLTIARGSSKVLKITRRLPRTSEEGFQTVEDDRKVSETDLSNPLRRDQENILLRLS